MLLGDIIRRERTARRMTQEELAQLLGVTAPAVNKWEKGNAYPDITLLAPIARLLGVSLDELLSFRDHLTDAEIETQTRELEQKLKHLPMVDVFAWAKKQVETYPNCDGLRLNFVTLIDCDAQMHPVNRLQAVESWIVACYRHLLRSEQESMRLAAAERLYDFYLARDSNQEAQAALDLFSDQNPEKKRKQAELYRRTGNREKALQMEEELLFTLYQLLNQLFNDMFLDAIKADQPEKAAYYTDKRKQLIRLFEMGDYAFYAAGLEMVVHAKDVEGTLDCVEHLLSSIPSLYAFTHAPLFEHMTFKSPDPSWIEAMQEKLLQLDFRSDEAFAYMRDDPRWSALLAQKNEK